MRAWRARVFSQTCSCLLDALFDAEQDNLLHEGEEGLFELFIPRL